MDFDWSPNHTPKYYFIVFQNNLLFLPLEYNRSINQFQTESYAFSENFCCIISVSEYSILNIILHWTLEQFLLIDNVLSDFPIASDTGPSETEKDS